MAADDDQWQYVACLGRLGGLVEYYALAGE